VIHHVQVDCPVGGEDKQRAFFTGVLGWPELVIPPLLAQRGGCWFRIPSFNGIEGEQLHVGVEKDFRPVEFAHPAFVVEVDAVAATLTAAGCEVYWHDAAEVPGLRRFHTFDPFGNRLEFVEPTADGD
jgi:catechol 2,3-dioxygenase-like lactoylglutathione lyase family enzyme